MEYRVLGPVEIVADQRVPSLGGFRQRLVLAVLLARPNQVVDTDWLVDAVWGDDPPRTARKTLQVYLARLRKLLGEDAFATSHSGYLLSATAQTLDSLSFESLAEQGRALLTDDPTKATAVLREALALWRGAPFGDLADAPALHTESIRLLEERLAVLEDRFDADLACGHGGDLVPELADLVAAHPLRERLRGQYMHALYRAERQAEALASYEQTRRLLADELGTDPGPALRRLHERILRQDSTLDAPADVVTMLDADGRNPYKGLRPFTEADAADFFGRDDLVDELMSAVASCSLVAVVGASGSGKSSAVRAGLVPQLRTGEPEWLVVTTTPGPHPFEAFGEAARQEGADTLPWRGDRLDLLRTLQSLPRDGQRQVLLVVDQFEELETQTANQAERDHYLENLLEVVEEPESGIVVLLTVRADFFDRLLAVPTLGRLALDGLVGVVPMSPGQIETAAAAPAQQVGVRLEPDLAAELVADMTNQPGALPLFQYALTETFDARTGSTLTRGCYRAVGGLRAALARRAEETFQTLGEDERAAARQVFLRLITIGEATEDTRRRVLRRELEPVGVPAGAVASDLDAFDRARLLTFDRDPASGAATVELAHEALISEWPRFSDWVRSARDDLRLHQRLAAEAAAWEASDHDPDYLLVGSRLAAYADWPHRASISPTAGEQEFLQRSRAEDEGRVRRRERAARRLRVLVAGLAVVALAASVLLGVTLQNSRRIEAAGQAAKARELAAAAEASIGVDADLGLLLALEAQRLAEASGEPVVDAVAALHHALVENRVVARFADVADVVFLPDGRLVVAGERTRVVDLDENTQVLLDTDRPVTSVAASADGRWIATGHEGARLRLWDAHAGHQVAGFPAVDPPGSRIRPEVLDVAFDPLGNRLASVGAYGWGLDIWSVETGEVEARRVSLDADNPNLSFTEDGSQALLTHADGVAGLSPDGTWEQVVSAHGFADLVVLEQGALATVDADGKLRVWDTAGTLTGTLPSGEAALTALAATADGERLAAGGTDGDLHVWTRASGTWTPHVQFSTTNWELRELALDASGDLLAGVDTSGSAYVWSVADALPGEHGSWPGGGPVAVSPDGRQIVAAEPAGEQATLRALSDGEALATLSVPAVGQESVPSLVGLTYYPDGTQIVGTTAQAPRERVLLQVWDAQSGRPEAGQLADVAAFGPAAVSDRGDLTAVACCGETTSAWLLTPTRVLPIGESHCGKAADLDAAGTVLAVQTAEGTVDVWDVESLRGRGWEGAPTPRVMSALHRPASSGSVAFSPDNSMLLTAGVDGTARVWDVRSGDPMLVLDTGGGPVEVATWTPDGSRIVTSSHDGVARVWDFETGHQVAELPEHSTWPHLAVTPDSRRLLTSADGVVRSWTLDTGELVEMARARLTRGLAASECERYGIDPCPA